MPPRAEGRRATPQALKLRLSTKPAATVATPRSSVSRPKYTSSHTAPQMRAKAPAWGSFRISSFRSRGAWEERASTVSQKPSMWMPPVTANGTAVSTAPRSTGPKPSSPSSQADSANTPPTAAPTRGKKARVYRIFFSLHSTWGMGSRE